MVVLVCDQPQCSWTETGLQFSCNKEGIPSSPISMAGRSVPLSFRNQPLQRTLFQGQLAENQTKRNATRVLNQDNMFGRERLSDLKTRTYQQ